MSRHHVPIPSRFPHAFVRSPLSRLPFFGRTSLLAAAIGLAASGAWAAQGTARNGLAVSGDARAFEVFSRAGLGGADYFCAAGDFARSELNARATDRVQIVRPLGPSTTEPTRRSVVFALGPQNAARNSGLDTVLLRPGRAGVSRSVALSIQLCETSRWDRD